MLPANFMAVFCDWLNEIKIENRIISKKFNRIMVTIKAVQTGVTGRNVTFAASVFK